MITSPEIVLKIRNDKDRIYLVFANWIILVLSAKHGENQRNIMQMKYTKKLALSHINRCINSKLRSIISNKVQIMQIESKFQNLKKKRKKDEKNQWPKGKPIFAIGHKMC